MRLAYFFSSYTTTRRTLIMPTYCMWLLILITTTQQLVAISIEDVLKQDAIDAIIVDELEGLVDNQDVMKRSEHEQETGET